MTRRLIAVGVDRSAQSDAAVEWACGAARSGRDVVHVVHAVDQLALDGCTWPPVLRLNEQRRAAGHRVVASAVAALRSRCPGLEVDGSAIAGPPGLVLAEMAHVVDLVVVGAPPVHPIEDEPVHRHVGRRLSGHAACPVVVCPAEDKVARDDLPVAVLIDGVGLPRRALDIAFDLAADRGVPLEVLVPWAPGGPLAPEPDEDLWLWETRRQKELDLELADRQEAHPGVGVSIELRRGDARGVVALCHDTVGLLVVAREGLGTHRGELLPATTLNRPPCPTLVVPAEVPMSPGWTRHAAEHRVRVARRLPARAW